MAQRAPLPAASPRSEARGSCSSAGGDRCRSRPAAAWGSPATAGRRASLLPLLLSLLVRTALAARPGLDWYMGNVTHPIKEQLEYCDTLPDLYKGIDVDLRHWKQTGITREMVDLATSRYTTQGGQKGVTLGFYDGEPYVLDEPRLGGLGHHCNILFTYMLVMMDLRRQYGKLIPDMEFVLTTSDRPLVLTDAQEPGLVPPVMRFCSSVEHADIQIPIFHFYTKKYTQRYLGDTIAMLNQQYPWDSKQPVVFGRFSKYYRYLHPLANTTLRLGAGNRTICKLESTWTLTCPVRAHFMEWAARHHPKLLDVKSGPRVSLSKHAGYKYLLHLDGQALSSRLDQLLPLGSLILKEESGYTTFYHHLLRPFVHYVPVWQQGHGPEDVLEAVRWAGVNEDKAQKMAQVAQEVAVKYLSKRARSCYWLRLFQAYGALMRYKPDRSTREYAVHLETYIETVAKKYDKGRYFHRIEY